MSSKHHLFILLNLFLDYSKNYAYLFDYLVGLMRRYFKNLMRSVFYDETE